MTTLNTLASAVKTAINAAGRALGYANVAEQASKSASKSQQDSLAQANTATIYGTAAVAARAALENRIYPGLYATDPTTRPDNTSIHDGDVCTLTSGVMRVRIAGAWQDWTTASGAVASAAANTATAAATTATNAATAANASKVAADADAAAAATAKNAAETAAEASGDVAFYDTKAAANAAVAGLANLQVVEVFADESLGGMRTRYRKEGGVLVFKLYPAYPAKFANGASGLRAYPRGSVLVHVGDSISVGGGEWGVGYKNGWLLKGGIFEGWTSYNLASNGSPASVWAAQIDAGNQAEAPADYNNNLGFNPWAAVNADPQVIVFKLGTNDLRMDSSAGAVTTLRANLAKLITFFLQRTSAHIVLKMPPPIAFANPDPNGFTNCVDANDAAARSASLRTLYREWENVTNRVTVVDLQKHLFGVRADTVAGCVDPEGQGALLKDTLHPTNLGATRSAQIIARAIDSETPYTSATVAEPLALTYQGGTFDYALVKVKESGNGYVDIYADTIRQFLGSVTRGQPRGPLVNIPRVEDLILAGASNKIFGILKSLRFQLFYPATGQVVTLDNPASAYVGVDGSTGDYWHVTATGNFVGSGVAYAYVTSSQYMPRRNPSQLAVNIDMRGALPLTSGACSGSKHLPLGTVAPLLNANTVAATRQNGTGTATIGLYVSNVWNGSYDGAGTTWDAAYPGFKLGTISFPAGYLQNATFTADPTNFPGGVASLPETPSILTCLRAVLEAGSLGDYGTVTIRAQPV